MLAGYTNTIEQNDEKESLGPTWIPLNFVPRLDHFLDTKNIKNVAFTSYLSLSCFLKNHACFGGGMHSHRALV